MKRHRLQITATARAQIDEIARWWRENRKTSPDLFRRELTEATSLIALVPSAGSFYEAPGIEDMRRLFLRRTKYHVYYTIDVTRRTVTIFAVWHSARGDGPPL